MLNVPRILVSARPQRLVLGVSMVAMLAGCGQKGPLFLPNVPAAAGRATLTETLSPLAPATAPTATPAASAPGPTGTVPAPKTP